MMDRLRLGVIGVGRWGTNYVRTINHLDDAEVAGMAATRNTSLEAIRAAVPFKNRPLMFVDYHRLLDDSSIDAIVVATPPHTHIEITTEALLAGKPVLVEKPFAFTIEQIDDVASKSTSMQKKVMVGYLKYFDPVINKLEEDLNSGEFGKLQSIQTTFTANGPVRPHINVLWDVVVHDISVFQKLIRSPPDALIASGASYPQKENLEDMVQIQVSYPDGVNTFSFASWLSPLKHYQLVIVGEKKYAVYETAADPTPKIPVLRYFDNRKNVLHGKDQQPQPEIITVPEKLPLTEEVRHFIDCVREDKEPITNLDTARKITGILQAAQKSLVKRSEIYFFHQHGAW